MSTDVSLRINGLEVTEFLDFRADADMFQAADAFSATFSADVPGLKPGLPVTLYIAGRLEFTGLLDAVEKSLDKHGVTVSVRGRNLMGLLVDSSVEQFIDLPAAESLSAFTSRLLKPVPLINRKAVTVSGAAPATQSLRIEPGQSVFDALKSAARARNLLFYALPDGTFVFGRAKTTGAAAFSVTVSKTSGSNILTGSVVDDVTNRYSKVTAIGTDGKKHVSATALDSEITTYKPLVTQASGDETVVSCAKYAQALVNDARLAGFSLQYLAPAFAQNGQNWTINALCNVNDEALSVNGTFLIFGRTFILDRDQGARTELRMSKLGLRSL
jgi:prophage tail gpP-like protein